VRLQIDTMVEARSPSGKGQDREVPPRREPRAREGDGPREARVEGIHHRRRGVGRCCCGASRRVAEARIWAGDDIIWAARHSRLLAAFRRSVRRSVRRQGDSQEERARAGLHERGEREPVVACRQRDIDTVDEEHEAARCHLTPLSRRAGLHMLDDDSRGRVGQPKPEGLAGCDAKVEGRQLGRHSPPGRDRAGARRACGLMAHSSACLHADCLLAACLRTAAAAGAARGRCRAWPSHGQFAPQAGSPRFGLVRH
jgi:hypothetical protein